MSVESIIVYTGVNASCIVPVSRPLLFIHFQKNPFNSGPDPVSLFGLYSWHRRCSVHSQGSGAKEGTKMEIQVGEREGYSRRQVLLLAEKGLAASAPVGFGFVSPAAAFGRPISLRRKAPNAMKASFLLIAIFSLLLLCPDVSATATDPHSSLSGDAHREYLRYQNDLESKQYLEYLKQNDPYNFPVMYYRLNRKPEPYPCPPCWIPTWREFGLSPHWTGNGALRRSEPPNGR